MSENLIDAVLQVSTCIYKIFDEIQYIGDDISNFALVWVDKYCKNGCQNCPLKKISNIIYEIVTQVASEGGK